MAYTGAWRRSTVAQPRVRLVPGPDARHATPEPDAGVSWLADTTTPGLPHDMLGEQYAPAGTVPAVVDRDVSTHDGTGRRPAVPTLAAQDERTDAHARDLGSVDARRIQPAASRDGSWHVAVIDDVPGEGNSPDYARHAESGVGAVRDPHARIGRRIVRWRDRWIDMHRWEPEGRPHVVRTAYHAADVPGGADLGPRVSPEPLYARAGQVVPDDRMVWPVERRSPRPWDEVGLLDGVSSGDGGLTVWGL